MARFGLSGLPPGGDLGRHRMEQLGTWADSAWSRAYLGSAFCFLLLTSNGMSSGQGASCPYQDCEWRTQDFTLGCATGAPETLWDCQGLVEG